MNTGPLSKSRILFSKTERCIFAIVALVLSIRITGFSSLFFLYSHISFSTLLLPLPFLYVNPLTFTYFLFLFLMREGNRFCKICSPSRALFWGFIFFLREGNRFCKICSPSRALLSLKLHYFYFLYPHQQLYYQYKPY